MKPAASILFSVAALAIAIALPFGAAQIGLHYLVGVVIPYIAALAFVAGFIYRLIDWAKSPVPFNITTTAGQQASLDWIESDKLESPSSRLGVAGRMFMEVFFFRSLFRNTKAVPKEGRGFGYVAEKSLWLGALLFHWTFFIIFLRHLRYFTIEVPAFVAALEGLDGMFQMGIPVLYLTDIVFLLSIFFLFARRWRLPQVRYFSSAADYFPLLLILAIGVSGVQMRYGAHIDIMAVKSSMLSLVSFSPHADPALPPIFYVHLFLVSLLFLYFPFSKLMHAGGVWFSPTRNMRADSRAIRHDNPWNYPVKTHTYQEYEADFGEMMQKAGLPLENPDNGAPKQDPKQDEEQNQKEGDNG